ncbi:MAG TPA: hypothetical protein VIF09_11345, partial [Polyangiaceae bacterium]
ACSKDAPPSGDVPATIASIAPSTVPADHLAPGELVEGKEVAFGVVLPRGLSVDERFVDVVHASGPLSVHSLVAYFRPRLTGGAFREGERSATFEHVSAPGAPADTELTLHVSVGPGKTLVDVTATPIHHAPQLGAMSDEERWKQQGLSPNGRVLDPQHMH